MSLGLVSPLLNRGVRSRWLASLPGAGTTKMLVIDSNGDTSFQDIPVAAWGSITGTLSAQTDLQNALNAKLSMTGGTLTGGLYFSGAAGARLEMSSQQYTPSNVAINMPWGSGTLHGIYGSNGLVGFASASTSYFEVNTSGLRLASTRSIAMGGTIASPEVFAFSGGSNVWEQRNSTNAQTFRLYGTYTDASNYRRLYLSSTTAGAFTIGVEGAGTGASGNTLTILNSAVQIGGAINGLYVQNNGNTQFWVGNNISFSIGGGNGKALSVGGSLSGDPTNESCAIGWSAGHVAGSISVGFRYGGTTQVNLQGTHAGAFQDLALRRLIFEGNTSSFPMLKRNGAALNFRLADDSADAPITAAAGTFSGAFTITQPVSTSGSPTAFTLTGAAHTTLTASTEATDVNFNLARTVQFAAGALTTQRAFRIQAPTYSFASASTITTASTLSISGAPVAGTNATITNALALNVEGGTSRFLGEVRIGDGSTFPALLFDGVTWDYRIFNTWPDALIISENNRNLCRLFGGSDAQSGAYTAGLMFHRNMTLSWTSSTVESNAAGDLILARDAANIFAQRNSTNSQTLRIYNTFTDASNYIRQSLSFTTYSTIVHAQLAAEGAGTGAVNVPFVITPRGTGAFILGPMPDGTATGGNARGELAVDLQITRTGATQVASGLRSFIAGTNRSVASGELSAVIGSDNVFASGRSSIVLGCSATTYANNVRSVAISSEYSGSTGIKSVVIAGDFTFATGEASFAHGYLPGLGGQTVAGQGSFGICGGASTSNASWSLSVGQMAETRLPGQFALSAGRFAATADAQMSVFVLRNKTTDNTATTLFLNGSTTRLTIPSGKLFLFTAKIVGVKSDGTSRACYIREGAIINIAGTTSLVGAITTIGADHEDNAATDVAITADDTNDALQINVTGITSETWRWVAVVEGVEVAYGT